MIPSSLTLTKGTHSSEDPQQLRVGEADEGERHNVAENEEEPGIVLAVIFGAHGVPVGTAGTLKTLGDEPARDQALAHCEAQLVERELRFLDCVLHLEPRVTSGSEYFLSSPASL